MPALEQAVSDTEAGKHVDNADLTECYIVSKTTFFGPDRKILGPLVRFFFAVALVFVMALPANAGLLAESQTIRTVAFSLRDTDKPMIEATIAGKKGVLMFDNGTPDLLFLNRAALPLPKGQFVARGFAASGQPIEVQTHPTPPIQIAGQALAISDRVRSGDFGFTTPAFGDDYLGFVGTKMIENDAFLLDYAQRKLVLFKVGKNGLLPINAPRSSDVVVSTHFLIWPGEQPTIAAALGTLPILADFDTGDSGTLYVTADTREWLRVQHLLKQDGSKWRLHGLTIGGVSFNPTSVRVVDAGGSQDFRTTGHADQLRLGASFLSANPCLWNYPAKTLTFLKPKSAFLHHLAIFGDDTK